MYKHACDLVHLTLKKPRNQKFGEFAMIKLQQFSLILFIWQTMCCHTKEVGKVLTTTQGVISNSWSCKKNAMLPIYLCIIRETFKSQHKSLKWWNKTSKTSGRFVYFLWLLGRRCFPKPLEIIERNSLLFVKHNVGTFWVAMTHCLHLVCLSNSNVT